MRSASGRPTGQPKAREFVRAPENGSFQLIQPSDSGLYITHRNGNEGTLALWHSDGSAEGTRELHGFGSELTAGGVLRFVHELPDGRTLWEAHTRNVAPSLWVSDGTAEGTFSTLAVDQVFTGSDEPLIFGGDVLGDAFYFTLVGDPGERQLWRTDGTAEGTFRWLESRPDLELAATSLMRSLGGNLVLSIDREGLGLEPWITDGTAEGTRLMADVCPGPCSSAPLDWVETGGPVLFTARTAGETRQVWASDFTASGTRRLTDFSGGVLSQGQVASPSTGRQLLLDEALLFTADDGATGHELWALPLPELDPLPPAGPWFRAGSVPGFETKVRITPQNGEPVTAALEPECIPETACFSGAIPGRSEVFVRVVGPKPNGNLWPTLVKFTTSRVEVWIRQTSTGVIRYYRLEGARPGFDELPGLFDRHGFEP